MTKPVIATLVAALSFSAFAAETKKAEGQSTIQTEDLKPKNKVAGDIDEEITNQKMRAESGSKSKWSISTTLNYRGGKIVNAFGAERPNLSGLPDTAATSAMGVNPSVRYRWSKNDSVTLGTEFAINTPFQGGVDRDKNGKQFNVVDPILGYSRAGKIGQLQTVGTIQVAYGTSNESRAMDKMADIAADYNILKVWGGKLTTGVDTAIEYRTYASKPKGNSDFYFKDPATGKADLNQYGGDRRVQYTFNIYPYAEYKMTDTYSLRTVFGYFNWKNLYGDRNKTRLLQTFVYQSVGVGMSISRDVYLYPNVQFLPGNMQAKYTNVALAAIVNVF